MVLQFSSCRSKSLLLCLPLLLLLSSSKAELSFNFYAGSCPGAELIIRNTVRSASSSDPSVLGKLLRLIFHDCFVQGCDASVLIRGNGTERSDPGNASLGGFAVIENAKNVLEIFCPGTVSCADILVLAARDAVEALGGPVVPIPTGRRDGTVSIAANVRPNIIDTDFTVDKMINIFTSKGLSIQDLVVLSGAHTIGAAHCNTFNSRFKQDPKGNLELIDSSLDNIYAQTLMNKCSSSLDPTTTVVDNDPETSSTFDNQYYKNLMAHKGLFQTDSALMEDDRTRKIVEILANDEESFFERWTESFMKMSVMGVRVGEEDGKECGDEGYLCNGTMVVEPYQRSFSMKGEWYSFMKRTQKSDNKSGYGKYVNQRITGENNDDIDYEYGYSFRNIPISPSIMNSNVA